MSGWSSNPLFNMLPLDFISNLVSPVLDIVSPLEDINALVDQGIRWYPGMQKGRQLIQQRGWKTPKVLRGQKLPQKYRIVIDCKGFNPNTLKTSLKCVQDNKHLIIYSDIKKGVQFKRSFTLPKEVETKKMKKFVTPNKQFVVEFCYLDAPQCLDIDLVPKICNMPEGKCVHVNAPIPDFVDPLKVQLHVKGRDLIVRLEERLIPIGDSCCRVVYHNRVKLPDNVDVSAIKAKSDKHKLTILAPVGKVATKGAISQQLREIPIQRKLRHRKKAALSRGVGESKLPMEKKGGESMIGKQQQKQKKQVTPSTKTAPSEKKEPITSKPTISEKKPTGIVDKPEEKKPDVSKPIDVGDVTTSEQKKKQKKKKSKAKSTAVSSTTAATPTSTSTPVSEEQQKKDVTRHSPPHSPERSTGKGADILKNIFETSGQGTTQQTSESQQTSDISGRLPPNVTSDTQQNM